MTSYVVQILLKCIMVYLINSKHILSVLAKEVAHTSVEYGHTNGRFKFHPSDLPLYQRQHALLNILVQQYGLYRSADTQEDAQGGKLATHPNRIVRSTSSGITYPYKTTIIIQSPLSDRSNHSMDVDIGPKATVLSTLIEATREYKRIYGNRNNPYNLSLEWEKGLGCYVVNGSLGLKNSVWQKWRITVNNSVKQIIYDDRCLPRDLYLTPGSLVLISFLPTLVDF